MLPKKDYSVSIIIPARNEAGTIPQILKRLPKFGKTQEIIFVEGNSSDNTWHEIKKIINQKSLIKNRTLMAFKQKGRGKADAVRLGFQHATGEILMILDSDLSVAPEDLTKFYKIIASSRAQFVNGSRFVYAKEKGAMRFFNHLGNKFFAFVFSLILRQKITDTLCGTKVLFKKDYLKIKQETKGFSHKDPYGDFELLLGAAFLRLKIREVPIKYRTRVYGKSNISPFIDGIKLIILLFYAFGAFVQSIYTRK